MTREITMNDLLNLAMKAHGGLERWKQVRNMQAKVTLNLNYAQNYARACVVFVI